MVAGCQDRIPKEPFRLGSASTNYKNQIMCIQYVISDNKMRRAYGYNKTTALSRNRQIFIRNYL